MYFISLLTRKGYLVEEEGMTYMAEIEPNTALAPLQSAACTYRIALGPRAGQKVLTLKSVPTPKTQESPQSSKCCVNAQGFSLHAEVRCAMNQRSKLERLCPLYYPTGHRQRTTHSQPCGRYRTTAQEPVPRRNHSYCPLAV